MWLRFVGSHFTFELLHVCGCVAVGSPNRPPYTQRAALKHMVVRVAICVYTAGPSSVFVLLVTLISKTQHHNSS